ncbi:MAG: hypothetical protein KKH22_12070 [Proteobacteria bacterium]|nr:hypothetical protein [Pseudomonadota bacterium]
MNIYGPIINSNIITIAQGSTYRGTVTATETVGGAPLDLTGYTVRSQLRKVSGELVGEFACVISAPAAGIVTRTMDKAVTGGLTPATIVTHVWGLELTAPDGSVLPEIQGGAMVVREVVT